MGDGMEYVITDDGCAAAQLLNASVDRTQAHNARVLARLKRRGQLAAFRRRLDELTTPTEKHRADTKAAHDAYLVRRSIWMRQHDGERHAQVSGHAPREGNNDRHTGSRRGTRSSSSSNDG
jgi:hypothetical protein